MVYVTVKIKIHYMNLLFLKNLFNYWRMKMLRELRENSHLDQGQLARALRGRFGGKWAQADISRYERGIIAPPDTKIKQMAEYFGVKPSFIRGEEDKNFINNSLQPKSAGVLPTQFGPDMIPILGHANASSHAMMLNYEEPIGEAPRHPKLSGVKNAYYVEVYDESMSPRYYPKELAAVNGNRSPLPKEDCVIQLTNGEVYIKQFIKTTDKKVICHQLNPSRNWDCLLSDVKSIHAVVGRG